MLGGRAEKTEKQVVGGRGDGDTWSTSDASTALANDIETESCPKTKGEVVANADVDVDV